MKGKVIITADEKKDCLVEFSKKYILDKSIFASIPKGYEAVAIVEGKAVARISSNGNLLRKLGKAFADSEIQLAFYMPSVPREINYGFGGINVNNDRLKEAYRVGVNGQMMITCNFSQLMNAFGFAKNITITDVKEKILPTIKTVGMSIVSGVFAGTMVSVFEVNSLIGEIRRKMTSEFVDEAIFNEMGVNVLSIAINEIFVSEDDLNTIRERINN